MSAPSGIVIPKEELHHFGQGSPPAMFGSASKTGARMSGDGSDFDGGSLPSVVPKKSHHSPPPSAHRPQQRDETPPKAVIRPQRPETPPPPVEDDDDFEEDMFSEVKLISLNFVIS